MKRLFFLMMLIGLSVYPQTKNESTVKVEGDNNVIKVIQGGNVKEFDLSDQKAKQEFESFMKGFPQFSKELRVAMNKNNQLLLKFAEGNTINPTKFLEEFGKLSIQNSKLKEEIQTLKKQTKDPELSQILDNAKKLLDEFRNDEYQEVLQEFKQKRKDGLQKEIAQLSYLQAQNNRINSQLDKALDQISESLQLDPINTDYIIEQGNIYNDREDYNAAVESFNKALTIRENALGKSHASTIAVYNYVGMAYMGLSKDEEALRYFKMVVEAFQKAPVKGNLTIAISYNNMGMAYSHKGNDELAIDFLQKAAAIYEKNLSENADAGTTYSNIGLLYQGKKDHACAQEYFLKALKIKEKLFGKQTMATANLYSTIGMVYHELKHYELAIKYGKWAAGIFEKEKSGDALSLSDVYYSIGNSYHYQNKPLDAITYLRKAEDLQHNSSNLHHKLTTTYLRLSDAYDSMGNYDESYVALKKALEVENSNAVKNLEMINNIHYYLGVVCINQVDFDKLEEKPHPKSYEIKEYFNKYITYEVKRETPNTEALLYAHYFSGFSSLLTYNFTEMTKTIQKALTYTNETSEIRPQLLNEFLYFSLILDGHEKNATAFFKSNDFDKDFIDDHITTVFDAVETIYDAKQYQAAINGFEYVLELMSNDKEFVKFEDQVETYNYLATSYCQIGKYKKALQTFEKGIAFAKQKDEDDIDILEAYQNCKNKKK